jgi:hypothetical protein
MMFRSPSRPHTAGPRWPSRRAQGARPGHVVRARRIGVPAVAFCAAGPRPALAAKALDLAA